MRRQTVVVSDSPVLIFGGCYSNLQASQAMRAKAAQLQIPPSQIFCNGDIVAYCAEPNETVELIRDWGVHVIRGNCETALANQAEDCGCGFDTDSQCSLLSQQWYGYSKQHLKAEHATWMATLADQLEFNFASSRCLLVHATPQSNNRFVYASNVAQQWSQIWQGVTADVVIGGHCGLPFGYGQQRRHWLNSGVIGMPANDGSAAGWFMLLQKQAGRLQAHWQRLDYDAPKAQQQMQVNGLQNGYAQCLLSGYWPSLDTLPMHEAEQTGKPLALESYCIV